MRTHFICGCGLENYNREDWISHFKHGRKAGRTVWRALWLLLTTRITFSR